MVSVGFLDLSDKSDNLSYSFLGFLTNYLNLNVLVTLTKKEGDPN